MIRIRSYDIFDTLIARRCIDPRNIFIEVEHASQRAGFAASRTQAEALLYAAAGAYDLDAIYVKLQELLGLTDAEREQLKSLEVDREVANAIPIAANLQNVEHGDLLISDMYLPAEVIRRLLDAAGFDKHVGIIVTSHGKRHGTVWPRLKDRLVIERHRGDNHESDVQSPLQHGIYGEHTAHAAPDAFEQFFLNNGLELLARIVRELRLRLEVAGAGDFLAQQKRIQHQVNLPILVLAATYVHNYASERGLANIVFCSRDCSHLLWVYRHLFAGDLAERPARYFYTSRLSRVTASAGYVSYANSVIDAGSLVVDLCGTGWSLGALYKALDKQPHTLLIHSLGSRNEALLQKYRSIKDYSPPEKLAWLTESKEVAPDLLEMVNYTSHGMVRDVMYFEEFGTYQPVLERPDYPGPVSAAVAAIEESKRQFAAALAHYPVTALTEEVTRNAGRLEPLLVELCKQLPGRAGFFEDISRYHREQDALTEWNLGNIGR
jgi:hypothetical protein